MKKGVVLFCLLLKRQMKKLSFYAIMLGMFCSTFFIRHVAVDFEVNVNIGILNMEASQEDSGETPVDYIVEEMTGHKGLIKFVPYADEKELEKAVQRGEVYAGYIFAEDFSQRMRDGTPDKSVTVITTPDNITAKIGNELVFSYVMSEYAYQLLLKDTLESGYFDEDEREIEEDLRRYYNENRTNGSTFSLNYSGVKETDSHLELDVFDYISPIGKGIIGVLIFLGGMCGALLLYQDKESGTFSRFTAGQTMIISLAQIFIPVLLTGVVGMACMIFTGMADGKLLQWASLLYYIVLVTAYCFALQGMVKKRIVFLSMIPIFMMASLLFCHVFINLSAIIPEFEWIARLLPPTYFL